MIEKREKHPSFGTIQLSRMTATPGVPLFNSPMRHGRYVRITEGRPSAGHTIRTGYIQRKNWSR